MGTGFRTATSGGVAAPPYTNGPYTFSEDITFAGAVSILGTMIFGDAAVDTLTIGGTATISSDNKFYFRDTGLYLWSSANGQFDAVADTVFKVTAPTVELEASTAITLDGDVSVDGAHTLGSGTGAVSLNGDVTVAAGKVLYIRDASQSIASASDDLMTLTSPTLTFAGVTKINLDGPVDVTGILTVDTASSPADGILIAATTPADGLHISSVCSANGINLAGANAVGINIAACTTTGIKIAGGASYNPIHVGVKSNSADAGLILVGATDDTGGVMVFCDDGGDALGSVTSPIWTRYLLTTSQSAGATATGLYAQIKNLAATFNTGSYTALKAYNQVGGATTLAGGAELSIINAGITYEGNMTVSSGQLSGVDINVNDGGFTIGTSSGLIVRKTSSSTLGWTNGIKIADAGAVTGIELGTCTTGISLAGAATTGISISYVGATASAKAISTAGFTLNNANLTDGYGAVECDLTLTGTSAGHTAALSSWVNLGAGTHNGGYICAQTNGVYESGATSFNGATVIFGMRCQSLCTDAPAKSYPFSVVSNTNIITAIFKCNAGSSDMGTTAVSKTTEGKYVPLYEDDAGVHYVLIYN